LMTFAENGWQEQTSQSYLVAQVNT